MNKTSLLNWPAVTRENKPWTRWWWPGSALDRDGLTRSLQELADAGFGGVEVTPIYGIPGYEDRFNEFLSPQWLALLAECIRQAESHDMGVDMPTGTGWPFGGPGVSAEDADAKLELVNDRLVGKLSGFKVKRAAPGGAGPALNPFAPAAMRRYLARFANLPGPRCHFHDSFEYHADWSPEVAGAFRKLCGYELESQAGALFGEGDPETVARVRADYRRTLAELHLQYILIWTEWAHGQRSQTRNQAHGAPGNLLDLYAAADVPETETFGATRFKIPGLRLDSDLVRDILPNPLVAQFASSAGHVQGRRLVSCESCTWLREHFNTSLAQMKPEIDQMFLAGINHIIYHGTCYSPSDAAWPGWLFYASVQLNPRNTIWRDVPALNQYVTRCQSVLQSGKPDNELLLYWPVEDLYHEPGTTLRRQFTVRAGEWLEGSPFGEMAGLLRERGYACDYISDRQVGGLRVEAGQLRAPDGSYRAILVPRCKYMPLETMERLLALAEAGAQVIFHRALPTDVPGLAELEERRRRLAMLRDRCRAMVGDDVEECLRHAGVVREPLTDAGLRFIRRRQENGTDYFVANLGEKAFDGWVSLGRPFTSAGILDPLTGKTGVATTRGGEVRLQMKPGQSLFVRTLADGKLTGAAWPVVACGEPVALSGRWQVEFLTGGLEVPPPFTTERLASWTELAGPAAEAFAGAARYRLEFDWQPEPNADDWRLALGDVRESARVWLNGQAAGTAWSIPFELTVGGHLRTGKNVLEMEVTNLCANRIRDMDRRGVPWKRFGDINMVNVHYRPLDAAPWPVRPSGLLGPVALIPLTRKEEAKRP